MTILLTLSAIATAFVLSACWLAAHRPIPPE